MTKGDIAAKYARQAGIGYMDAQKVVRGVFDVLIAGIKNEKKVEIRGLGVFKKKTIAARVGRDPRNGNPIQIPEKQKICFKPSTDLKAAVNDG